MKLTKEQRSELESQLNSPYGTVRLICDGRAITLQVQRYSALKYRVMTFVDGEFKGAWISGNQMAPEAKFLRKSVRHWYTPSERAKAAKTFGKRAAKDDPWWDKTSVSYMPDWASGKAALSHLCKVCDSVEIAPPRAVSSDENVLQ